MKYVTNLIVNEYKMREKGLDFMGYALDKDDSLQFHHLVIPKRESNGLIENGYIEENGVVLNRYSHEYLHRIEHYDRALFLEITMEMLKEKIRGELSKEELLRIRNYLMEFEREYGNVSTKKGKPIIKKVYRKRPNLEDYFSE